MDCVTFTEDVTERKVSIVGSELVENYTVYIIQVTVGERRWTIKHRYSDFHDLHEKLAAEKKVDKHLLPPKKMIGKNSRSLVEKRQKELEVYLQTLLATFPMATPKALSCFLLFHKYEVNGITACLAEQLFHQGEQLLAAGEVFSLRPVQLYAISQQLKLATPTCANGDTKADLGHILDFTCRLRYLKVTGSKGEMGSSNMHENQLPFDLAVFKALLQIEISECGSQQIRGLPSLRSCLATMSVHQSADCMMAILVPEASMFPQWEAEGGDSACAVTAVIPVWRNLTTLDMSHNHITSIDQSVKLIPKVEFLDLSHNELSSVDNLQHLYSLVHVDLSFNQLSSLEGAHTRLGNIKTLNLAGNQLDSLSGLTRLYSLVNLDLSHNKLAQLEEIRHIGALPCLEKLTLTGNPMCIIPDYRTKVLAQFWERAAEVCLDSTATTEKELDTVEVLKAIQKAKEAKDRMANIDKKETKLPTAGPHSSSSSSSSVAAAPRSSSPSPAQPPCSSQGNHVKSLQPEACLSCEVTGDQQRQCDPSNSGCFCPAAGDVITPVLPPHLQSLSTSHKDFITQLSLQLSSALWEQKEGSALGTSCPSPSPSPRVGSKDGYFEMGLNESLEEGSGSACSAPSTPLPPPDPEDTPEPQVRVSRVLWCYCVRVDRAELDQRAACLVLTDRGLVVFCLSGDEPPAFSPTLGGQTDPEPCPPFLPQLTSRLWPDCVAQFSDLLRVRFCVPSCCLSLGLRSCSVRWYLFSDPQSLTETHSELVQRARLPSEPQNGSEPEPELSAQQFFRPHLNAWEESEDIQGGFAAHILDPETTALSGDQNSTSTTSPWSSEPDPRLYLDLLPQMEAPETGRVAVSVPCLLFFTQRHLCVLKVDFPALAASENRPWVQDSSSSSSSSSSWSKLIRVPLASLPLHPRQSTLGPGSRVVSSLQHHHFHHRCVHAVDLLLGQRGVRAVFPVAQDRLLFLGQLSRSRASLEDVKTLAFLRDSEPQQRATSTGCYSGSSPTSHSSAMGSRPTLSLPLAGPSEDMEQTLTEENQPPSHLSLSPGLALVAGLDGQRLQPFFQRYIAEMEEELKHVLWSSVVFYKSPDVEITSCLLLSTKALYFLLEDSASALSHQSLWTQRESMDPALVLCYSLTMKLSDLHSVNVGLFDQYFRVVGVSPDQVLCCLSRDSYGTHRFLQRLMSVLSLQEKLPSPEPAEQDFYSQFGHKDTGKMQNYELVHSSRVKFFYPSEEEIGDLTFIVAERRSPSSTAVSRSFNILLYVLVFQVHLPSSPAGLSTPGPSPVLQPRTLILTSTELFLLEEDYISYPLPDFAKEPPSRDKYQLTDARRIRDLDRVLMGYQTYPQALTLVFDDVPGPDLLCHLNMDHFGGAAAGAAAGGAAGGGGQSEEVQWCIYVPGADSRERLICLLARQWEALCSRELPVELTG
ncbi:nischarin [Aplochiton taeniatus]